VSQPRDDQSRTGRYTYVVDASQRSAVEHESTKPPGRPAARRETNLADLLHDRDSVVAHVATTMEANENPGNSNGTAIAVAERLYPTRPSPMVGEPPSADNAVAFADRDDLIRFDVL
jgi:hypothetical protein